MVQSDSFRQRAMKTAFIAFTAVLAITICSKSSFLYPFNDWMDINCFMTVGKALTKGMIPYRDIYEQKGPFLYFLSAFAATVSHTSFIGFWILECVSAFFFLHYSWKTMRLLGVTNIFWIPIIALVVYSSGALSHGGSVEELCLPFFSYALYYGAMLIRDIDHIDKRHLFFVGVTSALVLWMKFSPLGFYLGWILALSCIFIKKKQFKSLLSSILNIMLGVIVVSCPILLWYASHDALNDLMKAYFYNNIFIYSGGAGVLGKIRNLISGIHLSLVYLPVPLILAGFGILYFLKKDLPLSLLFLLSGILTGIVIFSGGQGIQYYPLALAPLCVIGVSAMDHVLEQKIQFADRQSKAAIICVTILSALGMYLLSANTPFMKQDQSELPQFQFRDIISKEENPVLLNYDFMDGGFYTACDIYPDFKYFCRLNIELPEMIQAQNQYVSQRCATFVVTRNENPALDGYACIATSSYVHEGKVQTYYLYRLMDCK